jgi:hypothetical protein
MFKIVKERPKNQCHRWQALRTKHHCEADNRRQRPAGTSRGPTHHIQSLARAENGFPKPWWDRHRIECLVEQSSRNRKGRGPGPNEASTVGKGLGGETPGVK